MKMIKIDWKKKCEDDYVKNKPSDYWYTLLPRQEKEYTKLYAFCEYANCKKLKYAEET